MHEAVTFAGLLACSSLICWGAKTAYACPNATGEQDLGALGGLGADYETYCPVASILRNAMPLPR